jgi:tetratricopeptide (TPR) repeat protein
MFSSEDTEIWLFKILSERFNQEDLKTLCFELGVDYEDLPPTGKINQARELVLYLARRDRLLACLELLKKSRPDLPWAELPSAAQSKIMEPGLPKKNDHFTGRQRELEQTLRALQDPEGTPVVAIYGLGGIGKTALAQKVVEVSLAQAFFAHSVWVSAKTEKFVSGKALPLTPSELTFDTLLDEIIRQCVLPGGTRQTQAEKRQNIRVFLTARATLLVLDNLETAPGFETLLTQAAELLGGQSKILLTSRHKLEETEVFTIQLGGLDASDGLAFLREEGRRRGVGEISAESDATLLKIHTAAGGAPLALKLMVGQLGYQPLPVVLEKFQSLSMARQDEAFYRFIFKSSWDLLPPAARRALVSLSAFDPATGGAVQLVRQVSQMKEAGFFEAMQSLIRMCLVDFTGALGRKRYQLHPLTQAFVLFEIVSVDALPDETPDWRLSFQECQQRLASAILTLAQENARREHQAHEALRPELGNLRLAASLLEQSARWPELVRLTSALWDESGFLPDRGPSQENLPLLEAGLRAARETGVEQEIGRRLISLGETRRALGQIEPAIACFEEALALARQPADPAAQRLALYSLGLAWLERDVSKSLPYLQAAQTLPEGATRPDLEIDLLSALAVALLQPETAGQVENAAGLARGYLEKAFALAQASLDERRLADLQYQRGYLAMATGDYAGARTAFAEALVHFKQLEHAFGQGRALQALGTLEFQLGYQLAQQGDAAGMTRIAAGLAELEQALQLIEDANDEAMLPMTLFSLGQTYLTLGKLPEALRALERARELVEKFKAIPPIAALQAPLSQMLAYVRSQETH